MARETVGLLLIILFAGCVATPGNAPDSTVSYPDTPNQLNNSSAEGYALAYERAYTDDWLSERYGADEYDLNCCTAGADATVLGAQDGTYYVRVQFPYAVSDGGGEGDYVTDALYAVSENETNRINLDANRVTTPQYVSTDPDRNTAGVNIYLVNAAAESANASLTVTDVSASEHVYTDTTTIPERGSVAYIRVAAKASDYRVAARVGAHDTETEFVLDDSTDGDLFVIEMGDRVLIVRA